MHPLLISFCAFFAVCTLVVAEDTGRSFTFDLAQPAEAQTLPVWMTGQPTSSPSLHSSISFPITPPSDQSDLAVTFYFTESIGAFLRVYWAGASTSEMLSDNLFEGVAMPNQRTVLIKRSTLSSSGTLTVQSSETTLNVSRIHFEWVNPVAVSLADSAAQTSLIDGVGKVFKNVEINGAPPLPQPDQIQNSVVTASLVDRPVRIESGVEFAATLQAMPQYARLEVQISGVPVGSTVQLTLNGAPAGDLSTAIPDLNDPGYESNDGALPSYIGWRKGVIFLPVAQLKVGENLFQFGLKDVAPSPNGTPLAIKDLTLQLKYPDQKPGVTTQSVSTVIPEISSNTH